MISQHLSLNPTFKDLSFARPQTPVGAAGKENTNQSKKITQRFTCCTSDLV